MNYGNKAVSWHAVKLPAKLYVILNLVQNF